MAPISDSQKKAVAKYVKANYDRIEIKIPKGQKSTVEAAAKGAGESVNQYAQGALLARMGLTKWPERPEQAEE